MENFKRAFYTIDIEKKGMITEQNLKEYQKRYNLSDEFIRKWQKLFDPKHTNIITLETFLLTLGLQRKRSVTPVDESRWSSEINININIDKETDLYSSTFNTANNRYYYENNLDLTIDVVTSNSFEAEYEKYLRRIDDPFRKLTCKSKCSTSLKDGELIVNRQPTFEDNDWDENDNFKSKYSSFSELPIFTKTSHDQEDYFNTQKYVYNNKSKEENSTFVNKPSVSFKSNDNLCSYSDRSNKELEKGAKDSNYTLDNVEIISSDVTVKMQNEILTDLNGLLENDNLSNYMLIKSLKRQLNHRYGGVWQCSINTGPFINGFDYIKGFSFCFKIAQKTFIIYKSSDNRINLD